MHSVMYRICSWREEALLCALLMLHTAYSSKECVEVQCPYTEQQRLYLVVLVEFQSKLRSSKSIFLYELLLSIGCRSDRSQAFNTPLISQSLDERYCLRKFVSGVYKQD